MRKKQVEDPLGYNLHFTLLHNIFNKFFRGRNARGLPGSGLGLYMARSVSEVHGGTIELASEPGAALTLFKIFLPIRDAGKQLASAQPSSDNPVVTPG